MNPMASTPSSESSPEPFEHVITTLHPTQAAIRRHLAAAPKVSEADTPAIHCYVVIRGSPVSIQGSLSPTPEGGLRMLSPTDQGSSTFIEQFFDYQDVAVFAVLKEIHLESPLIVMPGSNRRS